MATNKSKAIIQVITKGAKEAQREFSRMGASVGKLAGLLGGAAIGASLVKIGKDAVSLAMKAEGVRRAFNRLDDPKLLWDLRNAVKGTVSDLELMQNAVRAEALGIPVGNMAKLFEFAARTARETGQSVDYLTESIVMGIGRQSVMILDNLGLNAKEIRDRFKETGDFAAAVGDIIDEKMSKMGPYVDDAATATERLNAQLKNNQERMGKNILPLWAGFIDLLDRFVHFTTVSVRHSREQVDLNRGLLATRDKLNKMRKKGQDEEESGQDKLELAYHEWVLRHEEKMALQQQEVDFQRRYKVETGDWQLATEMAYSSATAMASSYSQKLTEVAYKQDIAWDFNPATQYAHIVESMIPKIERMWSTALLSQWNEGQSFFENMARGFEQMMASMAASIASRAAIFGLVDMFTMGGAGTVFGALGGLGGPMKFLDFILPFQHGGSFTVGGGGMKDSQLVAFRASPGERVDVTPEGETGGVTINIHGNVDETVYKRDLVPLLRKIQMGVAV